MTEIKFSRVWAMPNSATFTIKPMDADSRTAKGGIVMAEYFAGGHLRFVNGEWRDDNGNAIEIYRVRHGRWMDNEDYMFCSCCGMQWNYCDNDTQDFHYCPSCGTLMDLEG